ncbi:MAG: hypothetical protein M1817_002523 [Caeruleum heppii]|nr:MAG: hypothetical protein M1817_002523 [Caeruleum heppii]
MRFFSSPATAMVLWTMTVNLVLAREIRLDDVTLTPGSATLAMSSEPPENFSTPLNVSSLLSASEVATANRTAKIISLPGFRPANSSRTSNAKRQIQDTYTLRTSDVGLPVQNGTWLYSVAIEPADFKAILQLAIDKAAEFTSIDKAGATYLSVANEAWRFIIRAVVPDVGFSADDFSYIATRIMDSLAGAPFQNRTLVGRIDTPSGQTIGAISLLPQNFPTCDMTPPPGEADNTTPAIDTVGVSPRRRHRRDDPTKFPLAAVGLPDYSITLQPVGPRQYTKTAVKTLLLSVLNQINMDAFPPNMLCFGLLWPLVGRPGAGAADRLFFRIQRVPGVKLRADVLRLAVIALSGFIAANTDLENLPDGEALQVASLGGDMFFRTIRVATWRLARLER